jgi:nitrate/nitrite transporter NarK
VGGISIPLALLPNSPVLTVLIITVTACAIFAALPNFWTLPTQFLSGAAAAAGVALINTFGNLGGFGAPYITGAVRDLTGDYRVPMGLVGFFMVLSCVLMVLLARSGRVGQSPETAPAVASDGDSLVS